MTASAVVRPERGADSLGLALGVLVTVSLIQMVTAGYDAGPCAVPTVAGAGFLGAGLWGLARHRRGRGRPRGGPIS